MAEIKRKAKWVKMASSKTPDEVNIDLFNNWIDRNVKPKTTVRGNRSLEFYIGEKTPEEIIIELNEFNEMCLTFSTLFSAFRICRSRARASKLRMILSLLTKSHVVAKKYLSYFVENPDGGKLINTGKLLVIQTLILEGKIDKAREVAKENRYELSDEDIKLIQKLKLSEKRGKDYISKEAPGNKEVIHANRKRLGIKIPNKDRRILNPEWKTYRDQIRNQTPEERKARNEARKARRANK